MNSDLVREETELTTEISDSGDICVCLKGGAGTLKARACPHCGSNREDIGFNDDGNSEYYLENAWFMLSKDDVEWLLKQFEGLNSVKEESSEKPVKPLFRSKCIHAGDVAWVLESNSHRFLTVKEVAELLGKPSKLITVSNHLLNLMRLGYAKRQKRLFQKGKPFEYMITRKIKVKEKEARE